MFKLDLALWNFLYGHCRSLGNAFCLGAFEGFIIYLGAMVYAVQFGLKSKVSKKNVS